MHAFKARSRPEPSVAEGDLARGPVICGLECQSCSSRNRLEPHALCVYVYINVRDPDAIESPSMRFNCTRCDRISLGAVVPSRDLRMGLSRFSPQPHAMNPRAQKRPRKGAPPPARLVVADEGKRANSLGLMGRAK